MEDTDEQYEVERILAEEVFNGEIRYLVKWVGYPDEQCTWEPRDMFDTDTTISDWENAKKNGDVLDGQWLEDLQSRMRSYNDQQESDSEMDELSSSEVEIGPNTSIKDLSEAAISTSVSSLPVPKRAKVVHNDIRDNVISASPTVLGVSSTVHQAIRTTAKSTGTKKAIRNGLVTGRKPQKRAGQRFRNLSHQNNYRKRSRNEMTPDSAKLKLIRPAELNSQELAETAHILPASRGVEWSDTLFIPEERDQVEHDTYPGEAQATKTGKTSSSLIPTKQAVPGENQTLGTADTEEPEPPTLRNMVPLHSTLSVRTNRSDTTADPRGTTKPQDAFQQTASSPRRNMPQTKSGSVRNNPQHISFNSFEARSIPIGETASNPNKSSTRRQFVWGEFVFALKTDEVVGDVKLTGVPWRYCQLLVDLQQRSILQLDFGSQRISRREYDMLFYNTRPVYKAVGRVQGFADTMATVELCSSSLKVGDECRIWHYPDPDVDISILLYCCHAESWPDIGHTEPCIGRSGLHVAFLQKVSTRHLQDPSGFPANHREGRKFSIGSRHKPTERPNLPKLAMTDNATGSRSSVESQSPFEVLTSASDYQTPVSFPNTPASHYGNSDNDESITIINRSQAYQYQLDNTSTATAQDCLALDYMTLVNTTVKNNVHTECYYFFIAFTEVRPVEAALTHKLLENIGRPTCILTASDDGNGGWEVFRMRARKCVGTILFLDNGLEYTRLQGLNTLLGLEHVHCYALSFAEHATKTSGPASIAIARLFPRGSVFLISESSIRYDLESTIFIVKYFMKHKKLGWQIMFRPRIRSWLLNKAIREENSDTRGKILDLLVRIQAMLYEVETDSTFCGNYEDSDEESLKGDFSDQNLKAYVLSPASLPNFSDDEEDARAIRSRDAILIDYFCGFAIHNVDKYRRFLVFTRDEAPSNTGHIRFENPQIFRKTVSKQVRQGAKKSMLRSD